MKIEHIGIAVKDLDAANEIYTQLMGSPPYKQEEVESEMVNTSFFMAGEAKVELLGATSEESVIAKYVERNGEGLHHVAFEVEDILAAMQDLREKGFRVLNEKPKKGADNKWVCFIHPKDCNGVLVELCQQINEGE